MKATFTSILILFSLAVGVPESIPSDPYIALSQSEKSLLKPQVERWVRDQLKHDWSDLWEIQDQTPELKNVLLMGRKDAPDMTREEYVQAMRGTIGTGFPAIKAFRLTEVDREEGGFQVVGCAKMQREEWKQTSIQYVHIRVVNGTTRFGLIDGSPEECSL